MFTGRAVTTDRPGLDHGQVLLSRGRRRRARAAAAALALAVGLLTVSTTALAGPVSGGVVAAPKPSPQPTPTGDGRVTFGITTASAGTADDRGFISLSAPPGAVVFDHVAVVNFSDTPLDIDLYAADVANAADGSLGVAGRADPKQLAGSWVTLDVPTVNLPAQSTAKGPGLAVVPVTITIPQDAEPGDHLAAVLSSLTTQGKPGQNTPAINLENRVGVRVYVTVQGDIRPGLTVTGVHTHFVAGGPFGPGTLEVEYTLTNSGNVRYGVEPSVRATGPFGIAPHNADGKKIDELLPHASVTQTVTLPGVFPLLLENVTVSATAVASVMGATDPGLGTVKATSWTWLWSWLLLVLLLLVGALVAWREVRRRRRRPGVWGPPAGLWGAAPTPGGGTPPGSPPGQGAGGATGSGSGSSPGQGAAPDDPVPAAAPEHGPSREPVR